ncbi:hypothetical protein [Pollutimonas bauzanensis]|uniref:Uncharacterized protein n=1 Tax=Pollutimonas bauzanensis TaxID=658167 RepID=A0A1M5MFF6_9BURK|nr:hypothetical protein [Pollutimonas bauzanensis]SHG75976.1 hypothetical protein SAMN04488135_101210 [Pollutimonas bauzanensis]
MGLFKSSGRKKPDEAGLSLLQGLLILAIIGIVLAVVFTQLAS